jgi:hypothetical protein
MEGIAVALDLRGVRGLGFGEDVKDPLACFRIERTCAIVAQPMVIEIGKTPVVECDVEAIVVQHDGIEKEAGGHRDFPAAKGGFCPSWYRARVPAQAVKRSSHHNHMVMKVRPKRYL